MGIKFLLLMGLILTLGQGLCAAPKFEKVMIVVLENADYTDAIKTPFLTKLAAEGALLKNFHGVTHPSQPNYIALVSGSTHSCTTNDNVNLKEANIADLLTAAGKTWKVYAEAFPGNCFKGAKSTTYVRKHNPFISFKKIQNDPTQCARIVDASELQSDVENETLPNYAFYVPDLNNDGHDTDVKFADAWYAKTFGPLIENPKFMKDMLLVTTFDESSLLEPTNHIYTSFYGAGVKPGTVATENYDLYSLLRTIEDNFGLAPMSTYDQNAVPIAGVWAP